MNYTLRTLCAIVIVCLSFQLKSSSVTLVCPNDVWLPCGAEIWDLSLYGQAHYYKNGYQYDAGSPSVVYDLTSCETGKIYRTWQVEDENWNIIECTQVIKIAGGSFSEHNITWPEDHLQLYGCNVNTHPDYLPEEYGRPTYDYLTCSMVGSSYKDQVFNFGPDCKKILRTWTVLDWCNYNSGGNNPGIWKYVQTIKVSGTDQPDLTCAPEVSTIATDCDSAYITVPLVTVNGDACYGGYAVTNDSPYADSNGADASGTYPIGKTRVNYRIEYACGQQMYCHTDVIIEDKGPVPYCLATLTSSLMPVDTDEDGIVDDGMVEVWAKDLDFGSYHPCNNAPLKFSFSSNVDSTFRVFTCEEVGYNEVQLWVTDIHGNQSWCAVTIVIQNNSANIPDCFADVGNKVVNGSVRDINSEPLENVYINLKSRGYQEQRFVVDTILVPVVIDSFYNAAGLLIHIFNYEERYEFKEETVFVTTGTNINIETDEDGNFGTDQPDYNRQYQMTAYKFGDNSRVDQTDVDILTTFLVEEKPFENPYTYLAADINEDGKITFDDLKTLIEIADGEEDEWPHERQWVFYNKEELENMSANPLEDNLEQKIVLKKGEFLRGHFKFTGILKGDLGMYESLVSDPIITNRNKQSDELQVNVYPNPFLNELFFENLNNDNLSITISNAQGKLLYSNTSDNSLIRIELAASWPNGTYLYTIQSKDNLLTGKLMKYE